MTRVRLVVAIALAAAPLAAQELPSRPPAPGPLKAAPFPPFQEARLPNGLQILVVENHRLPIVSISLTLNAGGIADPRGKEGLAALVAGLMTKGAGSRTADQIATEIESAGGSIGAGAGADFLAVNAGILSKNLDLAFGLLADAVARPTFPESEIELQRTQTLSGLELELSQPGALADRQAAHLLYGDHPYGRRATPESVRKISRQDILQFQRQRLRPAGALLVLAGDVTLAQARRLATAAFRGWIGVPAPLPAAKAPPARATSNLILVHRPGSVQSNIVVTNLTFGPTDPRQYPATVATRVLGGSADSRLFMILREQKSWTYGAYAALTRRKAIGNFEASTEVRTEVTDSALSELLTQLRRIGSEPIPPEELEAMKGAVVGSYPLSVQTAEQVANAVSTARMYGLPRDYVQTYRVKLGAVTAAEALAAAKAVIRPDQAVIVVVGDGAKIYDKLKAIGPVVLMDAAGKPLAPEDLSPKATGIALDFSALTPRRDSFAVMVQKAPLGWMRGVVERTEQGFRYTEDTRIASFVEQHTVVEMGPKGEMRSVRQTGKVQGQPTTIELDYAESRVKGTANTVGPGGPKTITIDTTIAPGTIDDNALNALLPIFDLAPGAKWTFPVFSGGAGETMVMTVTVAGTDTVALDAGPAPAYRLELSGGPQPATFCVSTAAPRRLLKIAPVGAPVEIVRVP